MKRRIIILLNLILLQSNFLFSDNWEPFPLNQTSYYKITGVYNTQSIVFFEKNDLLGSIGIINFDSVYKFNKNHSEYFSKKFNELKNDDCLISKLDSLNSKNYNFSSFIPDYYSIINDTLTFKMNYFNENNNFNLKLPLNLKQEDNFNQNSIDTIINYTVSLNIKLKSKEKVTTFGNDDSIMIFSIERKRLPNPLDNTFEIILSKNFGFLSFLPLDLLDPSPLSIRILKMELVSATNNSENFGETYDFQYRNRNNLEKPGDIKIYKEISGDLGYYNYVFIRDSIIGTDVSGDVVFVVFNRKIISTNQGNMPNSDKIDSYSYLKNDSIIYSGYNAMVDALKRGETFIPSTKLFERVPNKQTQQKDDSLEVIATPLLFKFVERCGEKDLQIYYNYQATLNREDCNLPTRYFFYRILDKTTDLWWDHGINDQTFEGSHIVGYKNGGCEWGDLSWPPKGVSVNENPSKEFLIFPNPTSDKLTLSQIPDGSVSYEIFDIFGGRVLSAPSLRDTPQEGNLEIDVSKLLSGIYFLKLNNQPPVKFVKI